MRWRVDHPLDVSVDEALAAALDPATLTRVPAYMPMVRSAVRVSQESLDARRVTVVDRFEPMIDPPPFARGVTRDARGEPRNAAGQVRHCWPGQRLSLIHI